MNKFKYLSVLLLTLLLGACGGGDNSLTGDGGSGSGEVDCELTPDDPSCPDNQVPSVLMGSGVGGGFLDQAMNISLTSLSAGGSTLIEVTLVLESDPATYYTDDFVDVTFNSACIQGGLASVDTNPVSTNTGIAQATYTAEGCTGDDVITATATVGGVNLSASGVVTVAAANVNAINFISADPELIGLKGTGGLGFDETSEVTFRVVDAVGNPVAGADVTFTLNTTVGGIQLSPTTDTSDASGFVQTVVTSGTVATTVRVSATVTGSSPVVATQSSGLEISTGLPDQDSFSIAFEVKNPEALDYDGVEVDITVTMSDNFNNPVPDGTSVSFNAESGSIEPNCQTTTNETRSGFCVVTWTSAGDRPTDGRVTILAHAIGEETFSDNNSNGVFDGGDTWTDIPEIFRDDNESGTYSPGIGEFFLDFNNNLTYDAADGVFNGYRCDPGCATNTTGVGKYGVVVMSGSHPEISDNFGGYKPVGLSQGSFGTIGVVDLSTNGFEIISFTIGDENGNPMPAGTTVTLETDVGEIIGDSTLVTGSSNAASPLVYEFSVSSNQEDAGGNALLSVETPGPGTGQAGVKTSYFITILDSAPAP